MDRYLLFAWNSANDYILSGKEIKDMVHDIEIWRTKDEFVYPKGTLIYEVNGQGYDQIHVLDTLNGNILQLEFKLKKSK